MSEGVSSVSTVIFVFTRFRTAILVPCSTGSEMIRVKFQIQSMVLRYDVSHGQCQYVAYEFHYLFLLGPQYMAYELHYSFLLGPHSEY